jgi:hypothetical protein
MEEGDLLLVDAAASYQHLTGDITRTYPSAAGSIRCSATSTSSCSRRRKRA